MRYDPSVPTRLHHRSCARRAAALTAALLVAACQPSSTPAPSSTTAGPTGQETEAPAASPPSLEPVEAATSAEKILAAAAAGEIDEPTAILYRVYATFADPRLPTEYRGETEEDAIALRLAREGLAEFPPDVRSALEPYLVRPSDPTSYWNAEPAAAAGGARLAAFRDPAPALHLPPGAPACDGLWMHERVSPNIPVMIWAQCAGDPLAAADLFEEARGYMASLYGREVALMRAPLGDRNVPNDRFPDTAETGDGLIDIYLISAFTPSGGPRDLSYGSAWAATLEVPPYEGNAGAEASSSYVVMAPQRGAGLEATLAHEFFHVLQNSINLNGTWDCPVRTPSGCTKKDYHWFVEASATWAAHYLVPGARSIKGYPRYDSFRRSGVGLADTVDANEYSSFAWPLFMQQEAGPNSVGEAWRSMEGVIGWGGIQAMLDVRLGFTEHFRDFGVRVLHKELLPGDPIKPRFRDPNLDPTFPVDYWPTGWRWDADPLDDLIDDIGGRSVTYRYTTTMDFLWTKYLPIEPPPGSEKLIWDFSAFGPEIDVDAVVRIDEQWERRKLIQGENVWCLDNPDDDFREGYLVFSNHDQVRQVTTRNWAVTAEPGGCGVPLGTLAYSFLDTAPIISQPGGHQTIDANVQVRLKINENVGDPYAAMFLNDGSTYGIGTSDKVLYPPAVDGCQPTFTSSGMPGGPLEIDSVTGSTWVDENGDNRLTLGISLPVHVETEEFWCALGSGHSTSETTVGFPSCDGTEVASSPTSQTFEFDCDFQGTSQSWSISGTIVINREPPP
ncbi:MAG: hypothetical protein M3P32_06400 [Chloroflexota bacterium]|nr:hypothetical protein [Chloroflexota bacterium]